MATADIVTATWTNLHSRVSTLCNTVDTVSWTPPCTLEKAVSDVFARAWNVVGVEATAALLRLMHLQLPEERRAALEAAAEPQGHVVHGASDELRDLELALAEIQLRHEKNN